MIKVYREKYTVVKNISYIIIISLTTTTTTNNYANIL